LEQSVAKDLSEPAIRALAMAFENETDMYVRGTIARALANLADFLEPGSSSRVFRPYADRLMEAIEKQAAKEADVNFRLTEGAGAMLIVLPQDEAVEYLRKLVTYAEATTSEDMLDSDVYSVSLDQARGTGRAGRLVGILLAALKQEKDAQLRWRLTGELCVTA